MPRFLGGPVACYSVRGSLGGLGGAGAGKLSSILDSLSSRLCGIVKREMPIENVHLKFRKEEKHSEFGSLSLPLIDGHCSCEVIGPPSWD